MSPEEEERLFLDEFPLVGSIEIFCRCGRMHAAIDNSNLSEDQVANYKLQAGQHSGQVVLQSNVDYVAAINVLQQTLVVGCECKGWLQVKRLLDENRFQILNYYSERAAVMRSEIEETDKLLSSILQ